MAQVINTTFQLKRGQSEAWERNNPILSAGEPGWTLDTHILKIGDGTTPWNNLEAIVNEEDIQMIIGNYLLDNIIEVSEQDSLNEIIASARPGTIIKLRPGIYPMLELKGNKSFPENLTIEGIVENETKPEINGIWISSDADFSNIYNSNDIIKTIMPKGLKIKNLKFNKRFLCNNCEIENLSITDCYFNEGANITIHPNGFNPDDIDNEFSLIRRPWQYVMAKNISIKNNTFKYAKDDNTHANEKRDIAIYVLNANNIEVLNNNILQADFNGVQIGAIEGYVTGKVIIMNNIIKNTLDRGVRISACKNADITFLNNLLISAKDENGAGTCFKASGLSNTNFISEYVIENPNSPSDTYKNYYQTDTGATKTELIFSKTTDGTTITAV